MPDDNLQKINQAVRDCLDRCYASGHAISAVADYVAELRKRPDWNPTEISQVHSTVLRILQVIVEQPPDVDEEPPA